MNIPRLSDIVSRIEANPEVWDQRVWHSRCGTAHCVAGHAQIDSGEPENPKKAYEDGLEWLELTEDEAEWLFNDSRTIADFRRVLVTEEIPNS